MKLLTEKLWIAIQPVIAPHQLRSPRAMHYRLLPGALPEHFQAEGLLVALEAHSLRSALTALLAAERWGALVHHNAVDPELSALLCAAAIAAGERIAFALPHTRNDGEHPTLRLVRMCKGE
jgi:hypothetical protein